MKKLLAILMCVLMTVAVFAACSAKPQQQSGGSKSDEAATSDVDTSEAEESTGLALDDAVIKDADAINLIKQYSAEELSLSEEDYAACSFMISGNGETLENDKYVKVIATIKNEQKNGDNVSYTFDIKGEYYIRFDGKQLLKKNLETGEYTEMELKAVPTQDTTVAAESSTEAASEEETTE